MTQSSPTLTYRTNVAAFVLNAEGLILLCRRADEFPSWQIPQGGVDQGEALDIAIIRELEEEIGTADVEILDALETAIRYDWPERLYTRGFCGQEQYYFLTRLAPAASIRLDTHQPQEFDLYEWVNQQVFLDRIATTFRAEAYRSALELFKSRNPNIFFG